MLLGEALLAVQRPDQLVFGGGVGERVFYWLRLRRRLVESVHHFFYK